MHGKISLGRMFLCAFAAVVLAAPGTLELRAQDQEVPATAAATPTTASAEWEVEFIVESPPPHFQESVVTFDPIDPKQDPKALRAYELLVRRDVPFPTVVISADDAPEVEFRYRAAGVSAYLRKPIGCDELVAAIEQAVRMRRPGSLLGPCGQRLDPQAGALLACRSPEFPTVDALTGSRPRGSFAANCPETAADLVGTGYNRAS